MITTILEGLMLITGIVLLYFNIARYLHIMQQSFYNFTEYMPTLKKTKRFCIDVGEVILFVLAIVYLVTTNIYVGIFWLITALAVLKYQIDHKSQVKKAFAITKRVRTIYTVIVFVTLAVLLPLILNIFESNIDLTTLGPRLNKTVAIYAISFSMYKHLAIILVAICNALSKPIVNLMNRKYIVEAKKILDAKNDMKIVGITGSYGKTSTKNIVAWILQEQFSTVMTPKSFNTTLGVVRSIRENIRPYTEVFVCEMGAARLGEIKEICGIVKPDFSVITSIGPQHLTTFKSIANVQKGKFEIITNAKENTVAVLNIDNEYIKDGIEKYVNQKEIITYSLDNKEADYHVKNISIDEFGSVFTVVNKEMKLELQTKLLGKHNIYNVLCAVAIAKKMGVTDANIQKAVKKLEPIEHRLELKKMQNILTLDDSFNSNPEGSKLAIDCLCMFKDKYRVLVTPGMIELGDKEYELNKKLGEYASKCDYVILVGDKTTKPIQDGLEKNNYTNFEKVKDVYEAFIRLQQIKLEHPDIIALIENDLTDGYS